MGMSYAVEYLLSLERPGGGMLTHLAINQIVIPIFPPGTRVTFSALPLVDDFADIVYETWNDSETLPLAFYAYGQYYGTRTYEGILTEPFLTEEIKSFVIIKQNEPAQAVIENLTNLNQYYSGMAYFLSIATEADYELVREALLRMGTSAKSEELAAQSNHLLSLMTPQPLPPLGGS